MKDCIDRDVLGGLQLFLREEFFGTDMQVTELVRRDREMLLITLGSVYLWVEHRDGKVLSGVSYGWGLGIDLSFPDSLDRLKYNVLRLLEERL